MEEGEGEAYDVWPANDAEADSGNSTLTHSPEDSESSSPSMIGTGQSSWIPNQIGLNGIQVNEWMDLID